MNREEAKKLLPIIEAFANGEDVQIEEYSGKFVSWPSYSFDPAQSYRIKPKPRECWVIICGGDVISSAFKSKENAEEVINGVILKDRDNWEIVKFREVIDED